MYSANFNGIESDGQLHNILREQEQSISHSENEAVPSIEAVSRPIQEKKGLLSGKLFSNINFEDILVLGVGLLLLSDESENNDLIILAVLALLLF